ncbi:cysteine desulfurase [Priestia aryabhattai]|uniref:cysteine desulfurase family protein n=1 Tax=Priestia TaxID=2800373 RepID=UPI000BF464E0|nr:MULTISPECIES: cysteine desulfurase family protein [Priestia]MCM2976754.1 cysteine desulfurase [Priestia aryabhattai]MED3919640.1 cysteine desulfurase family protein [Priestia aryabhattai]MED3956514.1 cysteine desulfurase family protein [Priestia aryabhattai]MED3989963.1 cysteine desulfurase family protein [Priestia aryabhattai]MED4004452.1 cysteine desulfurase family protein [Priestia aryabhattai]
MERIYVDHAATSPIHPAVVEKMTTFMHEYFGNPSSIHHYGRESRRYLDEARQTIAASIGAHENELIFTSGGTEADNMALIGVALANRHKGNHIITTQIEHHAVLHTCEYLEAQGFEVTYLPVDEYGQVSVDEIKSALTNQTILVSVMFGNNEVGAIQPIGEIGALLKEHGAYFHTDAVQAYGLIPLNVQQLGVDLLSVSAHKINGPKGMGFLYAAAHVSLSPLLFGGEQERKRRAGTENMTSIVGFEEAVKISQQTLQTRADEYRRYKEIMVAVLKEEGISFEINGHLENSLPHVLNLSFPKTNVESMLVNLDLAGIAASSGSACTAGAIDPSHVLVAMFGKGSERLTTSIRFSFGLGNSAEQIEKTARQTANIVKRLTM